MIFELRKFDNDELEEAISVMDSGGTIRIGDISIRKLSTEFLEVTGWSRYYNLNSLTQQKAHNELIEIKEIFGKAMNEFELLSNYMSGLKVEYNLSFDSGGAGLQICSLIDKKIKWYTKF